MGYTVALHTSSLTHQRINALAMAEGFARHGINARIVGENGEADLHVVQGPWFAFDRWKYHNTILIDRAYWGDPDSLSVHWLLNGEKLFTHCDAPRETPELKPCRFSEKSIFLCDYNRQPVGDYDAVRFHPANGQCGNLLTDLEGFGVAVGVRTTALVDAAINGLKVVTFDPHSPVWPISGRREGREQWINRLAWHNWSLDEITRGEAWEYLSQQ